MAPPLEQSQAQVPVTVLNHILSNQQGLRSAVLVKEFGEGGSDNELVVATVVAIGKGMDQTVIKAQLEACVAAP
jgi:hypothetical protein